MSETALHRLSRSRFAFPAERAPRIKGERCGWNNQRLRLELTSAWVSEDGNWSVVRRDAAAPPRLYSRQVLICSADLGFPLNRDCPFIDLGPNLVMAISGSLPPPCDQRVRYSAQT